MDPTALWRFLGQKIASGIGGRTEALACPKDSPKWFHPNPKHSDLVHGCATTSKNEGAEVAEVQIKSNRGVSLEVTVPGDPAYVKVEGQPRDQRQWLGGVLNFDPDRTVILPAGKTMWVGYEQVYTKAPWSFFVTGATWKAATDTAVRGRRLAAQQGRSDDRRLHRVQV